jgi:hypothetical protein
MFKGNHPARASVQFLPMIDIDPGNLTCIYSTLSFIVDQANRYGITPIITFDQPLWWKALMIILNEPKESGMKSIVLRLGGLHIQMSFLGCIGHIMAGSGLADVLELIYAKNAVVHMLSGKAIARAVRGHFLVDSALNCLLMRDLFNIPLQIDDCSVNQDETESGVYREIEGRETVSTDNSEAHDNLEKAEILYEKLLADEISLEEACSADVLNKLAEEFEKRKGSLTENNRTAALWMQYMRMIDLLKAFIKAERTGNWNLHMTCFHTLPQRGTISITICLHISPDHGRSKRETSRYLPKVPRWTACC